MYINNLGHMTKMAAMPIYGKNPSKIFFSETNRRISRKLGVEHLWLKYSNVYINHDPVMTLTKIMARSTWVAYAFELGKLLKCHLKGKASRKLANGLKILKRENGPRASSAPALELNTIIFKHVYWYMQQISGERLQDHWSSGSNVPDNGSISRPLYYKANMLMLELDPTRENWSSGFPTRPQGYKSFFMLNSAKTKIYPADKC